MSVIGTWSTLRTVIILTLNPGLPKTTAPTLRNSQNPKEGLNEEVNEWKFQSDNSKMQERGGSTAVEIRQLLAFIRCNF